MGADEERAKNCKTVVLQKVAKLSVKSDRNTILKSTIAYTFHE